MVNLRQYDNAWYSPGRSFLWRAVWMFIGLPIFRAPWFASSNGRAALLRLFGAQVGQRVVIRQHVIVKYPWRLIIGDDCWIGEQVWIDNLVTVRIGNNVCLSQGAYLCTGNHDWSDPAFGLRTASIELSEGSWAGAKAILMPGVTLHPGAIATAGSVVTKSVPKDAIVMGNPAAFIKQRRYSSSSTISSATKRAVEQRQEVTQ